MPKLWVQESFINATEGYRFGDSEVYESWCETVSEVYHYAQKEYGRCMSKIYHDDLPGKAIGWVFIQRQRYEDAPETYLRETWVTVHDGPTTVVRTPHYHPIGG